MKNKPSNIIQKAKELKEYYRLKSDVDFVKNNRNWGLGMFDAAGDAVPLDSTITPKIIDIYLARIQSRLAALHKIYDKHISQDVYVSGYHFSIRTAPSSLYFSMLKMQEKNGAIPKPTRELMKKLLGWYIENGYIVDYDMFVYFWEENIARLTRIFPRLFNEEDT